MALEDNLRFVYAAICRPCKTASSPPRNQWTDLCTARGYFFSPECRKQQKLLGLSGIIFRTLETSDDFFPPLSPTSDPALGRLTWINCRETSQSPFHCQTSPCRENETRPFAKIAQAYSLLHTRKRTMRLPSADYSH